MINFKQMIGLIILSLGMILIIYSLRAPTSEANSGTLVSGSVMLICGITVSLVMNKQEDK